MSTENKIATAEQIWASGLAARRAKAEAVTAPSGARYLLYRPSAGELLMLTGMLPQSLAAQIAPGDGRGITVEEQIELGRQRAQLLEIVVVEPEVRLHPRAGGLSVFDIPDADREFAVAWTYGQIASDGSDLRSFRSGADTEAVAASR
jgi:hypothetical protein